MKRDEVLNMRVPAEIKEALRQAAEADDRSVSTLAVRILREWLVEQGYVEPERGAGARRKHLRS